MVKPEVGARIANSTGVPGTRGWIAHTLHDPRPVLLSTWHVLFGNNARHGNAVWLVNSRGGKRSYSAIGRSLYGKLGVVSFGGDEHYIDCAVASCFDLPRNYFLTTKAGGLLNDYESAQIGSRVKKTGAATGTTSGIIIDIDYVVPFAGRNCLGLAQILIRPIDQHQAFSAEGDSGALIVNESDKAVGLLWGINTRGEGIACPIAPVLYAMDITLARPSTL